MKEEIYMEVLFGFGSDSITKKVCKLKKADEDEFSRYISRKGISISCN